MISPSGFSTLMAQHPRFIFGSQRTLPEPSIMCSIQLPDLSIKILLKIDDFESTANLE